MTQFDSETIDVRPDEKVDLDRLEPWLRENLEGAEGPLTLRQFGGGHANLTYLLDFGENQFVLRRPPLGPVAPSAHDMAREHRILSRLWRKWPLAPRSFVLCTDHAILGADFHVLERREGFVLRATNPEATEGQPELRRRIGAMMADVLASFHRVDPNAVGLGDLGKPEGFVERQVGGWSKRWDAALDETSPDASAVMAWFQADIPQAQAATLVHNDYKLDNVMVAHYDPARAVAVLDWDMCTRGDPLLDLANLVIYWSQADDNAVWRRAVYMPTDMPGFPTRAELVAWYAEKTGFDVSRFGWYEVFGTFKVAVILQQIYIRYLRGQTQDERFVILGDRVKALIQRCEDLIART
jgi:aminoglycoside phosphotransferase (APT) family kinase protein